MIWPFSSRYCQSDRSRPDQSPSAISPTDRFQTANHAHERDLATGSCPRLPSRPLENREQACAGHPARPRETAPDCSAPVEMKACPDWQEAGFALNPHWPARENPLAHLPSPRPTMRKSGQSRKRLVSKPLSSWRGFGIPRSISPITKPGMQKRIVFCPRDTIWCQKISSLKRRAVRHHKVMPDDGLTGDRHLCRNRPTKTDHIWDGPNRGARIIACQSGGSTHSRHIQLP